MKKTVLIAVAALALASCKKDYMCKCSDSQGNTLESFVIHDTKSNAKTRCSAEPIAQLGISCTIQ